jgi:hypothetical protein
VEDAGKRDQDLLIAIFFRGTAAVVPRFLVSINQRIQGDFHASDQCLSCRPAARRGQLGCGFGPDGRAGSDGSRRRKAFENEADGRQAEEMKAHWSANKGKLAVCRKEVKSKGLAGDDRWFYIEDCMAKT